MPQPGENSLLERLNLRVEQLDYAFVRECGDARVLEKVLRVLRSGEEGLYPHLIEYVEERLAQVKPESRLLVRPQPPIRPHDLPPSELAALEADLATWAADLRREEDQRKTGRKEKEEEEDVKVLDDDDEEDEEEEQILSPTNIPSDLPPLDNFSSKILLSKVKKSRDALITIKRGHKSPGSLITDISSQEDQKAQQTNSKTVPSKKTPLIEVIENEDEDEDESLAILRSGSENKINDGSSLDVRSLQGNQEQGTVSYSSEKSVIKVTGHSEGQIESENKVRDEISRGTRSEIVKKKQELGTITYTSGGSVIKVTGHSEGHAGSGRAVEGLLREAERQQAKGDLLSASLTYNKVLSVCPHNTQARSALASLLCDSHAPASVAVKSAAGGVLVQEIADCLNDGVME